MEPATRHQVRMLVILHGCVIKMGVVRLKFHVFDCVKLGQSFKRGTFRVNFVMAGRKLSLSEISNLLD